MVELTDLRVWRDSSRVFLGTLIICLFFKPANPVMLRNSTGADSFLFSLQIGTEGLRPKQQPQLGAGVWEALGGQRRIPVRSLPYWKLLLCHPAPRKCLLKQRLYWK